MGVISDFHRVVWVSADHVDVINDPQQGTHPQAHVFQIFGSEFWERFQFFVRKPDL